MPRLLPILTKWFEKMKVLPDFHNFILTLKYSVWIIDIILNKNMKIFSLLCMTPEYSSKGKMISLTCLVLLFDRDKSSGIMKF